MKEEVRAPGCGRENDLIAYLYGELDPDEGTVFRSHMQQCQSCSAELREFTNIRESVGAWRNESLMGVSSPGVQASAIVRAETKPTALAALREFFNLSPLWMKGAVVFASVLFCLFAVLAAARLGDSAPAPVAVKPDGKTYSEQELKAIVERRVQDELQRIKNSSEAAPTSEITANKAPDRRSPEKATSHRNELASTGPQQKARRPLSRVERQQLAADLRLVDNTGDGELDLLDDRINE